MIAVGKTMFDYDKLARSIVQGDESKASDLAKAGLDAGIPAMEILNKGLMKGIQVVGEQFRTGEIFLPEVLLAGKAMKAGIAILKPAWQKEKVPSRGKIAIGTVEGDVHDIGKNIVLMMMEGNGWETVDLGVNVPADEFCSAVREMDLDVLGMSALLTTTTPRLKEVIEALKAAGLRDIVKVMVGGTAVTQEYADEIGADSYGANAVEAAKKAAQLLK